MVVWRGERSCRKSKMAGCVSRALGGLSLSRYTVLRDVKEIFQMSQIKVANILKVRIVPSQLLFLHLTRPQAYPGKLHLCADGWTSPNVISFIGITVHWASEGQIVSLILDFVK